MELEHKNLGSLYNFITDHVIDVIPKCAFSLPDVPFRLIVWIAVVRMRRILLSEINLPGFARY